MKIAVCIKQVPTREWQPRLNDAKTWIREQDASYEMNEPDAYALEEGLRLKEKHGGDVVVCSAGPARVAQVIREALGRGAAGGVGCATEDRQPLRAGKREEDADDRRLAGRSGERAGEAVARRRSRHFMRHALSQPRPSARVYARARGLTASWGWGPSER